MPATVPNSNISFQALSASFPNLPQPYLLSSYTGVHPSGPSATSNILLSSMRGLTSLSPAHNQFVSASGSNVSINSNGNISGTVGVSAVGSITYDVSSLLAYPKTSKYYNNTVTYAGSNLPSGFTISSNGILSINTTSSGSGNVFINVTNGWNNTSTLTLPYNLASSVSTPTAPTSYKYRFLRSDLSGTGNGASLSNLGLPTPSYGQGNSSFQPKFYTSGGYNNTSFVRFLSGTPTQLLNTATTTLALSQGLTVMFLMKSTEDGTVNKNNYARFMSVFFTGGGYLEIARDASLNNMILSIYSANASGSYFSTLLTSTGNSAIPTNQWNLIVFHYDNSTRAMRILHKPLATVVTSISAASDLATIGSMTATDSYANSTTTVSGQDAFLSYKNTSIATPALDFGGGYIFERPLGDAELLNAANWLLAGN